MYSAKNRSVRASASASFFVSSAWASKNFCNSFKTFSDSLLILSYLQCLIYGWSFKFIYGTILDIKGLRIKSILEPAMRAVDPNLILIAIDSFKMVSLSLGWDYLNFEIT